MKSLLIAFGCVVVAVVYARLITRYATRQRPDVIHRFQDRSAELQFLKGQTVSERKKQAWR